jgi:hypothetical protein
VRDICEEVLVKRSSTIQTEHKGSPRSLVVMSSQKQKSLLSFFGKSPATPAASKRPINTEDLVPEEAPPPANKVARKASPTAPSASNTSRSHSDGGEVVSMRPTASTTHRLSTDSAANECVSQPNVQTPQVEERNASRHNLDASTPSECSEGRRLEVSERANSGLEFSSVDLTGGHSPVRNAYSPSDIKCAEQIARHELENVEVDPLRRQKMRRALGEAVGKEEGGNSRLVYYSSIGAALTFLHPCICAL